MVLPVLCATERTRQATPRGAGQKDEGVTARRGYVERRGRKEKAGAQGNRDVDMAGSGVESLGPNVSGEYAHSGGS